MELRITHIQEGDVTRVVTATPTSHGNPAGEEFQFTVTNPEVELETGKYRLVRE